MPPSPDDRFAALLDRSASGGWAPEEDDDFDRVLPGTRPIPRWAVILAVVGLVVVASALFWFFTRDRGAQVSSVSSSDTAQAVQSRPGTDADGPASSDPHASGDSGQVTVHVVGAVKKPGIVRLPAGSRLIDALSAAGGAAADADAAKVNLARRLTDGEQIVVPRKGEKSTDPQGSGAAGTGSSGATVGDGESGAAESPKINLNTADESALDTLPGVGPATAKAIIAHREENGSYTSVEDLEEVPGIGPATMEKLRELVTV